MTTKSRGMIFSGPMVRALLDGRKTMTRRIIKPQPPAWIDRYQPAISGEHWIENGVFLSDRKGILKKCPIEVRLNGRSVKCPHPVGSRIWVRETWCQIPEMKPSGYFTDPKWKDRKCWYAADNDKPMWGGKWRSPMFMPRWASRLTLEVESVKVERLQEIAEADAISEGMTARLLVDLLRKQANKAKPVAPYWNDDGDGGCWMGCFGCAMKRYGSRDKFDGGWSGEEDIIRCCDDCGCLLDGTLTDYGIEEMLDVFAAITIDTPNDAWSMHRVLNAGGNPYLTERCGDWDYMPELLGKVARICFREYWRQLHGPESWDANPWVWVYGLKVI